MRLGFLSFFLLAAILFLGAVISTPPVYFNGETFVIPGQRIKSLSYHRLDLTIGETMAIFNTWPTCPTDSFNIFGKNPCTDTLWSDFYLPNHKLVPNHEYSLYITLTTSQAEPHVVFATDSLGNIVRMEGATRIRR